MLAPSEILWAFQLSALVYVITCVLFEEGYLLEWYYDALINLKHKGRFGKWISKPLGLCEKCTAGQFALWVWLYFSWTEYLTAPVFAILRHAIFIAFCIIFVSVLKYLMSKWKK